MNTNELLSESEVLELVRQEFGTECVAESDSYAPNNWNGIISC